MSGRRAPRPFSRPPNHAAHAPRKRFGQHFIHDRNILAKLVQAAEIQPGDVVLEIGPGLGDLTRSLARAGAQVAAVEIDRDLAARLRTELADLSQVHIADGNILDQAPEAWLTQAGFAPPYAVVANLPYYITSAILRYLLESGIPPSRLVLMVQREVAQQIVARPPAMNLLGLSVQFFGLPKIVDIVPAGAFFPRPKVDSAIVRVDVMPLPPSLKPDLFFQLARAGFSARRKQLHNALANGLGLNREVAAALLNRAGIDPLRRAETLTLSEWQKLYEMWIADRKGGAA
jgi:16S rRNA (adenine1518-N6/adenine1519-N6)-dimethyltransferase